MFATHSAEIAGVLRKHRLVEPAQLAELELEHRVTGRPLADLALERGWVERGVLLERVAADCGCELRRDLPLQHASDAIASVPGRLARRHGVMPWRTEGRTIDLLVGDPFGTEEIDALAFELDRDLQVTLSDPEKIALQIRRHYGDGDAGPSEQFERMPAEGVAIVEAPHNLDGFSGEDAVITFVNQAIARAIADRASDLHFEPFEQEFKVRYRIDGVLHDLPPPARELGLPITSRVKVLANLNIAERRVAQDGRIKVAVSGRTVDLRVSTLPTQFGESVVLRILDQSAIELDLDQLGMPADVLAGVRQVLRRPNGIFIVTGPTGCGKTTTLYSGLRLINTLDLKLLTVEDPVEYEIEGIMQVPVNPTAGLTFASALRSFLRQDPDVVMVGEIRDLETAQIAIQAALTGHLVLTTLHTNDAAGAITRLIDMGVEPFLIASTVEAVLAQRLVRRVCTHCGAGVSDEEAGWEALGVAVRGMTGQMMRGRGCPQCVESGYHGRLGIYEFLRMSDELRELVTARAPAQQLRQTAIAQGMRTLREDGLRAILDGRTTVEEVLKVT